MTKPIPEKDLALLGKFVATFSHPSTSEQEAQNALNLFRARMAKGDWRYEDLHAAWGDGGGDDVHLRFAQMVAANALEEASRAKQEAKQAKQEAWEAKREAEEAKMELLLADEIANDVELELIRKLERAERKLATAKRKADQAKRQQKPRRTTTTTTAPKPVTRWRPGQDMQLSLF